MKKMALTILVGIILVGIAIGLVSFGRLLTPSANPTLTNMEPAMPKSGNAMDFSNIMITEITATTATIEGTTDKDVNCLEYGTDNLFPLSASDRKMKMDMPHTEHKVTLSGLAPNTTYNYRFKATLNGETFYSDTKTFTTTS